MDRLARLVTRSPRRLLALGLLLVVLSAALAGGAFTKLKTGGFEEAGSEASRGAALLADRFGVEAADLVVLVTADEGLTVDDPAVARAGRDLVAEVRGLDGVDVVAAYWDAEGPAAAGLRSEDGRRALVVLGVPGDESTAEATTEELSPLLNADLGSATAVTGGYQQISLDINSQVEQDLATAEAIAVPLTLALLLVVFGSVVAGLLPLLIGGVSIFATFATLGVLASTTDVSIFALNLTTALGLGLGVDYALLIVSRYREELARGRDPEGAVTATLRTAGRTILYSAMTVAVALAAMLVFPLYFLRSFAYAGIAVVIAATLAALVLLPALLLVLGPRRLERGSLGFLRRRAAATTRSDGGWARLAALVMRRPVLTAAPVLVILAIGTLPLLGVQFGLPDDRVLPRDVQGREVGDVLRTEFATQDSAAMQVVLPSLEGGEPAVAAYATALSALDGVSRVTATTGVYAGGREVAPFSGGAGAEGDGEWLSLVPSLDPNSPAAERLVDRVRAVDAPGDALVTGLSANLVDSKASIGGRLWLAGGLVALSTFVLLFLFTGSVVVPLKALLLNVVSLGAVLGAMVWVFQEGNGADLLGFTPQPIATSMPILLFCVAFGLSMDYEVFLLGRITEEHAAGADTRTAVAVGLERTGRVVTLAAVLLSITFFAFTTSGVSFIQFFGLGTGLAIVIDATLVRAVLVPALMRVMGEANWWAPAPLKRLHARIGLREGGDPLELPAQRAEGRVPTTV